MLFGQAGGACGSREGDEALLVEEVPRREQERGCKRDRVNVVQDEPLGRRVEQLDEREAETCVSRPESPAREPEARHRPQGDGDSLGDEKCARMRPDPPERNEDGDDRIEIASPA